MIFYINSVNFATATTAYTDSLLTIVAPDGYYSDGSSYRRQLYGELVDIFACPSIDTVSITNIGTGTATFNGSLISNGGDVNAVRGFVYGTSINPTIANNVVTDSVTGQGTYSLGATGLDDGSTYYVRAYSTIFGQVIYGDELTFATMSIVTIPTLITATIVNITTTSATSGGGSINANNGVISAKGIQWSATQDFASILGSTSNGTGTSDFSSNLTSLTPDNTYWVRSYATNEAGTGYGSPLSFLTSQTVVLAPFDYIIVTYQYTPPVGLDYDLDTLTTFRYPESTITGVTSSTIAGFIPGTGVVGCGTSAQLANSTIPSGGTINDSYLTFGGDDSGQSVDGAYGESVVINFKNLEDSGILDPTKNIIISELFAGWHEQEGGYTDYPIEIKYETYVGGTITNYILPPIPPGTPTNRYISDGTRPDPAATSSPIIAAQSGCSNGVTGLYAKRKMASISYNRTTKAASVTFL
jgi:hypothetical protein